MRISDCRSTGEWGQRKFCILNRLCISPNSCQDLNVKILPQLIFSLSFALATFGADCPKDQPKTETALIEQNWALALNRKDAAAVVADEYEEVDVDGSIHTRNEMLEHIPRRKTGVNHPLEVRAQVESNCGRWLAVAGHDTLVSKASR
jgi:hypothetical protein